MKSVQTLYGNSRLFRVMPIVTPLLDGLHRVLRAPVVLAGATILTTGLALPLGALLHGQLQIDLLESIVPSAMAAGVALDLWQQFLGQVIGLERSFTTSVIGFAAVLTNSMTLFSGDGRGLAMVTVVAFYLSIWTLLSGGIIDRYARNRPTHSAGFFAACGLYGSRLLRLSLIAGLTYSVLFSLIHGWLFGGLYEWMTRNVTADRPLFAIEVAVYLVFGLLLMTVSLVFDYARVRAVVEDRRSMIGALLAGWRFVRRRVGVCVGLYAANGLVLLLILALSEFMAPPAETAGRSMWITFLISQAYLVVRLASKLLFYATETAYFQSQLAHASYVAAPAPVWPESPSAEALRRLG